MTTGVNSRGIIMSRHFSDADEFARAIRDAVVDYIPLEAGPYRADLTTLQLGSMLLQRAADRGHMTRGMVNPRCASLLMPLAQFAGGIVNSRPLAGAEVLVLAPGCEIQAICPARHDWASISLAEEDIAPLLELGGLPTMHSQPDPMLQVPPGSAVLVRRTVAAATELAESQPGAVERPALAASLANRFWELIAQAFFAAEHGPSIPRQVREAVRLVSEAEEFLLANMARPIYTNELCSALSVSPRKLHHAFMAVCGTSPQAYLKRRRLTMVHQALRTGGPDAPLVKSVALAHGFWHLGNFAHDYREQFGQTPSETLAATRTRESLR